MHAGITENVSRKIHQVPNDREMALDQSTVKIRKSWAGRQQRNNTYLRLLFGRTFDVLRQERYKLLSATPKAAAPCRVEIEPNARRMKFYSTRAVGSGMIRIPAEKHQQEEAVLYRGREIGTAVGACVRVAKMDGNVMCDVWK